MKHSLDKPAKGPRRRALAFETLEPRLLLSADLAPALAPLAPDALPPIPAEHRALDLVAANPQVVMNGAAREVVFVDASLPDRERLLADVLRATGGERPVEVIWLDPARDGVAQVSEALATRAGLDAVHLVTHGSAGRLQLGASALDAAALAARHDAIAGWAHAIAAEGDLLLYGCDVAAGAPGDAFVDALARLTGADVAASDDPSGASVLGGDWNLERTTGPIQAVIAVSSAIDLEWVHTLAAFTADWDTQPLGTVVEDAPGSNTHVTTFGFPGGATLTVTVSDPLDRLGAGPAVSAGYTGGFATDRSLEIFSSGYAPGQSSTITVAFAGFAGSVSNVRFMTFDVDTADDGANFVDQLVFTANAGLLNPTLVAVGPAASDAAGYTSPGAPAAIEGANGYAYAGFDGVNTVTGRHALADPIASDPNFEDNAPNGASNGNVYVVFGQGGITSITFSYQNSRAPSGQAIALHDIRFDVNEPPAIGGLGTLAYTENAAATVIAPGATVSDVDSADFDGGSLTVSFVANGTAADQLAIRNQGTGAGQIGVAGASVTFGGVTIGSFAGGANGTNLVVTLNANATPAAVQALAGNVTYANASEDPSTVARTVRFTVNDGDGGSASADATINVTAVNDAPTIGAPAAIGVTEDLASALTGIGCADLDAGSGAVTVTFSVPSGTLAAASGGGVTVGGTATALTLTGTVTAVDAFIAGSNVAFTTAPDAIGPVTLTVAIDDGGNTGADPGTSGTAASEAASTTLTLSVTAVNDPPQFAGLGGLPPSFVEGGVPVVIDGDVTVSDPELDAADDYGGAALTIARQGGANAQDLFSGAGNLAALAGGGALVLGGTTVGTVTTNAGGTLALAFNANATAARVDEVLRSIAYANASNDPPASVTLAWTFSDGNAGNAQGIGANPGTASGTATVSIIPVNDAPTLAATGTDPAFVEDAPAVSLYAGAIAAAIEAGQDFDALVLTVAGLADGAAEQLRIDGELIGLANGTPLTAANGYTVDVSLAGGTATVTVTRAGAATRAQLEALVDGLAYRNASQDPTAGTRTVTLASLSDTGPSTAPDADTTALALVSTVSVTPVNDAPAVAATANNPVFVEDGAAADVFAGVAVSTVEAGQAIDEIVLTVANVTDGASEVLAIDGTDVALTHGNGALTAGQGLTVAVSLAGSTATVTGTRAGGIAPAVAQALLDGLAYRNSSQDPTAGSRTVTLASVRDTGGTANGGSDTALPGIAAAITVVPVNDPPVLGPVSLTIDPLQTVTMGATNMSATDVDAPSGALVFLVAGVANGQFELAGAPGVAVTNFTQAQLAAGEVRFVHTNAALGPSFAIFVSDGAAIAGPGVAVVSFRAPGDVTQPREKRTETPLAGIAASAGVLATPAGGLGDPGATAFLRTPAGGGESPATAFAEAVEPVQVALARPVRAGVLLAPRIGGTAPMGLLDSGGGKIQTAAPAVDFSIKTARHGDDAPRSFDVALESARITGMALSVGAVWWAARAGGLLASMLASAPAWRHIDPLPVLGRDQGEPDIDWTGPEEAPMEDEASMAKVFGDDAAPDGAR